MGLTRFHVVKRSPRVLIDRVRMRGLRLAVGSIVLLVPTPGASQLARGFDHVHFQVPDPAAAQAWYVTHLDGIQGESPDRVTFGGMPWPGHGAHPAQLLWARSQEGAGPVSGSAILALGISVPDVDARTRALEAAGVRVIAPPRDVPGRWRTAVVEDPWGVRIELVQDPTLRGLHHVTVRSPDPEAARDWYVERFGGSPTSVAGAPAVRYEVMMLLFERGADQPLTPGYGINHIGWSASAIDAFAARLRDLGVSFTTEPRPNLNSYGHRVAFLQGPSTVRIEVVEHTRCAFTEAHH